MDPFSATVGILQIATTCAHILHLVQNAHESAEEVLGKVEVFAREIETFQNVMKSVGNTVDALDDLKQDFSAEDQVKMEEISAGILQIVGKCHDPLLDLKKLLGKYQHQQNPTRLKSLRTIFDVHRERDNIRKLRERIRLEQDQLQSLYQALQIRQIHGAHRSTSSSISQLRIDVKQLSNQSKTVPVETNKFFMVSRSVASFFTGRDDLLQALKDAFDQTQNIVEQKRFVIYGFPGSGKTEFCHKFLDQYRESFWGIFVVDASSHDTIVNSFARIIQYTTGRDFRQDYMLARQWFTDQKRPWLLVFDNADDPKLDLAGYFPLGSQGCILITTRNPSLQAYGNIGQRFYHFEGLPKDDSNTLLLKAAEEPSPYSTQALTAAPQISDELQCLPLALVYAGRAIKEKRCTWTSYIRWYKEIRDRYYERIRLSAAPDDGKASFTIIPTFEPLLRSLEQSSDETDTRSLELLHTLSYFHHKNIPLHLLKRTIENTGLPDFIIENDDNLNMANEEGTHQSLFTRSRNYLVKSCAWLFVGKPTLPEVLRAVQSPRESKHAEFCYDMSLSFDRLRQCLERLKQLSLIWESEEEDSYSLHPLVHSWLQSRLSKPWRKAVWCEAASQALASCVVLDFQALTSGGIHKDYIDARIILPHIEYASKCKRDIDHKLNTNRVTLDRPLSLTRVMTEPHFLTRKRDMMHLLKYSVLCRQSGKYKEALDIQGKLWKDVVAMYGFNHEFSIHVTLALGSTERWLGNRTRALELQQEVVRAAQNVYGADHIHTLYMTDLLATFMFQNSRIPEARQYAEQAMSRFDNLRSRTDPNSALGRNYQVRYLQAESNVGATKCRFFEHDKALEMCEEALRGLEKFDPDSHEWMNGREAVTLVCYWSNVASKQRGYEVAVNLRNLQTERHGKEHPLTLWATALVIRALWTLGRYDEALDELEVPLKLAVDIVGKDHHAYKYGEMLKAMCLRDKGLYDEALPLLLECDRVLAATLHHCDRLDTLRHLMKLYELRKEYSEAISTGETMKNVLQTVFPGELGMKHPWRGLIDEDIARLQLLPVSGRQSPTRTLDPGVDEGVRKRGNVPGKVDGSA